MFEKDTVVLYFFPGQSHHRTKSFGVRDLPYEEVEHLWIPKNTI